MFMMQKQQTIVCNAAAGICLTIKERDDGEQTMDDRGQDNRLQTTDDGLHDLNQTTNAKIKTIVLNVCLWSVVGLR